jgi:hypothetical protein
MVAEFGSSFALAPEYMKNKEAFNEIAEFCEFPEVLPVDYIMLLSRWLNGMSDDVFLEITSLVHADLFEATYCLISVYSGGSV